MYEIKQLEFKGISFIDKADWRTWLYHALGPPLDHTDSHSVTG